MKTVTKRILFLISIFFSFNLFSQCTLLHSENSKSAMEFLIKSTGKEIAREKMVAINSENQIVITKAEFDDELKKYKESIASELENKQYDLIKSYTFCMVEKYVVVEDLIKK